jgi:hypothetical protein
MVLRQESLVSWVYGCAILLGGLLAPAAYADIVCIQDVTEGTPTVKVFLNGTCDAGVTDVTASRVTIEVASAEFLEFRLALGAVHGVSDAKLFTQMWEDKVGGTLSDVLLFTAAAALPPADISFCSDPVFCNTGGYSLLTGGLVEPIENGRFQFEGSIGSTGLGSDAYDLFVQSDLEVPEPGSGLLLLSVAAVWAGTRRRASARC